MKRMIWKVPLPLAGRRRWSLVLLAAAAFIMVTAIWGPEALTKFRDVTVLNVIHEQPAEEAGEGYRYTLSSSEKLAILSRCLNSQTYAEDNRAENGYAEMTGTYAFIINHKEPSEKEISYEEIYSVCNQELDIWKQRGMMPGSVKELESELYEAVLYSAIDVLEPRNNVAVWKISLSDTQKNADKKNRVMDAYIDAYSGKIYELYARTELSWEEVVPDDFIKSYCTYLELPELAAYDADNPLMETTPYFKKYLLSAASGDNTVVTLGFYEGINELFLKVSK